MVGGSGLGAMGRGYRGNFMLGLRGRHREMSRNDDRG